MFMVVSKSWPSFVGPPNKKQFGLLCELLSCIVVSSCFWSTVEVSVICTPHLCTERTTRLYIMLLFAFLHRTYHSSVQNVPFI